MAKEHPFATLTVGTLQGNVRTVLMEDTAVAEEAMAIVNDTVHQAHLVKRRCQETIGTFFEHVFALEVIQPSDRVFFDYLCPRVKAKAPSDERDGQNVNQDDENDDALQIRFLKCFMTCLYTKNPPSTTGVTAGLIQFNPRLGELCRNGKKVGVGEVVGMFIRRLEEFGIQISLRPGSEIRTQSALPAEVVVRSVATQLGEELNRMYCNGSHALLEKVT